MEIWPLIAGLGLFLFGMTQLEAALKALVGDRLRDLLRRHSGTPLKGLLVGAGSTLALQSSSLVMVLVLAFVGAGVVELRGALGVVYGANLGTTATGWLVATLGFKLDLGSAALGFIGVGGIAAALLPAGTLRESGRLSIGLGLILFGLDQMKAGVEAWAGTLDVSPFSGHGRIMLALFGLVLTAVIQSSSGTMMITLSALHGGLLDLPAAAAIAVGSNVGSTLTGVLGSIGGTPDKKRVAAAHVLFNTITAVVALVLLGPLLAALAGVGDPLIALVLFHSLFNVLGILMFLPLSGRFASFLEDRFVAPRELVGRHVHRVEPTVPDAALAALAQDVRRAVGFAIGLNRHALRLAVPDGSPWVTREDEDEQSRQRASYLERYQRLKRLEGELIEYAARLQRVGLETAQTRRVNQLLQAARDAVLSAKALKDVREDLVPLRHRPPEGRSQPGDALHEQAATFYRAIERIGPGTEATLLVESIGELGQALRAQHEQRLQELYRGATRIGLDEEQISSLLNLNRALRRSGRALLRAIAALLTPLATARALDEAEAL